MSIVAMHKVGNEVWCVADKRRRCPIGYDYVNERSKIIKLADSFYVGRIGNSVIGDFLSVRLPQVVKEMSITPYWGGGEFEFLVLEFIPKIKKELEAAELDYILVEEKSPLLMLVYMGGKFFEILGDLSIVEYRKSTQMVVIGAGKAAYTCSVVTAESLDTSIQSGIDIFFQTYSQMYTQVSEEYEIRKFKA